MNNTTLNQILDSSTSDLDIILDYIVDDNLYKDELEYFNKFTLFEYIFDNEYRVKKKNFYLQNNIYDYSRYRLEISDWMLERIIKLDLYDSMDKYALSGLINLLENKKIYLNIKKKT